MSLQLFVLVVDTLGRLLRRAHSLGILQPLHPRRHIPAISLYADDVMVFCHATADDAAATREILALFGRASGLQVNFAKSSATILHGDQAATKMITHHGRCCRRAGWWQSSRRFGAVSFGLGELLPMEETAT